MTRWPVIYALVLAACGEDAIEPAQLGEVCGVQGPFRLVELAPDERSRSGLLPFDGRYVYTTARQIGDQEFEYTGAATWSVGTCGESPRRLAEDLDYVRIDPLWPDVLLGCSFTTNGIVTVDPAGMAPPHLAFPGVGCFAQRHSSGFLALIGEDDEDTESPATLSIVPFPADPRTETAEPVVLLAPDSHPDYPISEDSRLVVLDDGVVILTTDGVLLHISLPGGVVTVEQTGVLQFELSGDGRYLLYQDVTPIGDPERREGLVFLRDRTTGEGMALAQTNLQYYPGSLRQYDDGIITLTLPTNVLRVYFLPALAFVDLPREFQLLRPLADGRWLLQKDFGVGPIYLADLHDLDSMTMLFGGGHIVRAEPDGVVVIDAPICCIVEDSEVAEGGLWYVPFDGSTPQRVADRASNGLHFIDEQRLLTAVDKDPQSRVADLLLVDVETGSEQLVDHGVWGGLFGLSFGFVVDGVLNYSVVDGERSGIWLARLPGVE